MISSLQMHDFLRCFLMDETESRHGMPRMPSAQLFPRDTLGSTAAFHETLGF